MDTPGRSCSACPKEPIARRAPNGEALFVTEPLIVRDEIVGLLFNVAERAQAKLDAERPAAKNRTPALGRLSAQRVLDGGERPVGFEPLGHGAPERGVQVCVALPYPGPDAAVSSLSRSG